MMMILQLLKKKMQKLRRKNESDLKKSKNFEEKSLNNECRISSKTSCGNQIKPIPFKDFRRHRLRFLSLKVLIKPRLNLARTCKASFEDP